jgi:hypothetical protein
MENPKEDNGSKGVISSVASLLEPGESVVHIWKGYHPSRDSSKTAVSTRMFRGERNVGAPDPALLVLTDRRILVLDCKGVFRRRYVQTESTPLDKISQVETVGAYHTDVRIKGDWGYYSSVEFKRPINVDRMSLEESGIEDPKGVREQIMAGSERVKASAKK